MIADMTAMYTHLFGDSMRLGTPVAQTSTRQHLSVREDKHTNIACKASVPLNRRYDAATHTVAALKLWALYAAQ
jgi:hypothetical protein